MERKLIKRLVLGALGLVVLFQVTFLLYFRDFYGEAEKAFFVPGLAERFVPQGMAAYDGGFFLSGYMSDTNAARLYRVMPDGGSRAIQLYREDGDLLYSHAGGVATSGRFTYLAGGGRCHVFSTEELLEDSCESATALGSFPTFNRASFCSIWEGMLLVGEYAYGDRYPTAVSHHATTPAGDRNHALILAFPLDGETLLGVQETPWEAWSIPERVQGLSITADGRVALSASSALGASQLYLYDWESAWEDGQGVFWVGDVPVPLYYLDSDDCTDILHLPPQAEETVFTEGRLYILFESASRRFQYGRLVGGDYVYRMRLPQKPMEV